MRLLTSARAVCAVRSNFIDRAAWTRLEVWHRLRDRVGTVGWYDIIELATVRRMIQLALLRPRTDSDALYLLMTTTGAYGVARGRLVYSAAGRRRRCALGLRRCSRGASDPCRDRSRYGSIDDPERLYIYIIQVDPNLCCWRMNKQRKKRRSASPESRDTAHRERYTVLTHSEWSGVRSCTYQADISGPQRDQPSARSRRGAVDASSIFHPLHRVVRIGAAQQPSE